MKLYNSERAGQSDAAASWPRSEKKLKDFLPVLQRNAFSRITHADFRHFTAPAEDHVKLSTIGHGLQRIENQIQQSLLQQSAIDIHLRHIDRQKLRDLHFCFA